MLKRLSISHYVIISKLSVDFAAGLTVVTGETGAGKSILLDALGLILGDDADFEAIRQGEEAATIEGLFDPPALNPIWNFLSRQEILQKTIGPEILIKRVIGRSGQDTITVNGSFIDLPLLRELGGYLAEIHGQFANQNFLSPDNQLSLLDAFGAYPPQILQNVVHAWSEIGRITRDLEDEKVFYNQTEKERKDVERVVTALETLGFTQTMFQEKTAELARLTTSRSVCELFQSMNAQLVAQTGVEMSLARIDRLLGGQKDPALDVLKTNIRTALEQTRSAIQEMNALGPNYLDVDLNLIRAAEKNLEDITAIASERKIDPSELFDHFDFLSKRLTRMRNAPAKIKQLGDDLFTADATYKQHASVLSDERRKAAKRLSTEITGEMPLLKLPSAQVEIEVSEQPSERTARGFNQVSFTARMNPGMPFSPIAKTASGGELSRLILAVKMILQAVQAVSTLVFDEIDSGIGGAAAAAVGSRISKLADTTQILVITHSPQVAARGDQHLHVSKKTDGATTQTATDVLPLEKRVHEVSRMLAGEEVTEESLAAARTLIDEARASSEARKLKTSPV